MSQFNFDAIGTSWQIDIYESISNTIETSLLDSIKGRIDIFDRNYSRFRTDSLITKMSKEPGTFTLPDDAEKMLSIYKDLYDRTDGLITPLIGNLISDAGYDAKYSLHQKNVLQAPPVWEEALEYRHPILQVKKPVILDFGAAGKGYLVDIVASVIEANNIHRYCIDAGGDILRKDSDTLSIGLENPFDTNQVIGICKLGSGSICGSAGTRRAWGDFTHIMNPKTLSSPKDISAVWVTAETALVADALATCLFFVSPLTLEDKYQFQYIIVRSDGSINKSQNFPGNVF